MRFLHELIRKRTTSSNALVSRNVVNGIKKQQQPHLLNSQTETEADR